MNLAEAMDEAQVRLGRTLRADEMELLARTAPQFDRGLEALLDLDAEVVVPSDEALDQTAYEQRRRRVKVPGRKKPITVEEAVDVTDLPPVDMSHLKG